MGLNNPLCGDSPQMAALERLLTPSFYRERLAHFKNCCRVFVSLPAVRSYLVRRPEGGGNCFWGSCLNMWRTPSLQLWFMLRLIPARSSVYGWRYYVWVGGGGCSDGAWLTNTHFHSLLESTRPKSQECSKLEKHNVSAERGFSDDDIKIIPGCVGEG